jgi:hypothetical protein
LAPRPASHPNPKGLGTSESVHRSHKQTPQLASSDYQPVS